MPRRYRGLAMALVALALLLGAWLLAGRGLGRDADADQPLGLFTSLPILWTEQADIRGMLSEQAAPHWARAVIERHGRVRALDTLIDIRGLDRLVIAQPRPLSPEENVALDDWVRKGGRLLLLADPMLTQESAFSLGDRRRPQDVVLLSPILGRWGLELRFDDAQPAGERESAGEAIPVNLPGEMALRKGGLDSRCAIGPDGLVARCTVGKGHVTVVADAAVLEPEDAAGRKAAALEALLGEALAH